MESSLPIINGSYEIYRTLVEINHHLTRRWAYTLGASAKESVLNLLENLIMSKNAPKALKAGYLLKASGKLETCRMKLRLYQELKLANETKIFQMQAKLEEVGRMLGGWLRSLHAQ